jgi:hypothetical protein
MKLPFCENIRDVKTYDAAFLGAPFDRELWTLGLGIAAVVLALGYFIKGQPGK